MVGAARMNPMLIGMFIGMADEMRMGQGSGLFVSGWILERTISEAFKSSAFSLSVIEILRLPVFVN